MPLRHMPVLAVAPTNAPSFKLAQTTAILRYIAKTHDLEADSAEEQAFCDMYAEQIQDYVYAIWVAGNWSKTFYGTKPVEERERYFEEEMVPRLNEFGELFSERMKTSSSGYMVGTKLTWVDIFVANFVDELLYVTKKPDLFSKFPLIEAHHKKIFALPAIVKYVSERPSYPWVLRESMDVVCAILALSMPLAVHTAQTSKTPPAQLAVSTGTLETATVTSSRPLWVETLECNPVLTPRLTQRCSCKIPEDVPVGTRFFEVPYAYKHSGKATDRTFLKTSHADVAWRHFDIVQGMLILDASLDREQWSDYTLEGTMLDTQRGYQRRYILELWISVMDANDHPPHFHHCQDLPIVTSVDSPIGTKLHTLSISDHDITPTEFMTSLSGPYADYFAVSTLNQSSGRELRQELEVAKLLVDSGEAGFKVTITAHDQGNLSASCDVRIVTADVPYFLY